MKLVTKKVFIEKRGKGIDDPVTHWAVCSVHSLLGEESGWKGRIYDGSGS